MRRGRCLKYCSDVYVALGWSVVLCVGHATQDDGGEEFLGLWWDAVPAVIVLQQ